MAALPSMGVLAFFTTRELDGMLSLMAGMEFKAACQADQQQVVQHRRRYVEYLARKACFT